MEFFIFIILIVASIIGGGYLIGYLTVNSDSLLAVLTALAGTIIVVAFLLGGLYTFANSKETASETKHYHCPYCNELIEE